MMSSRQCHGKNNFGLSMLVPSLRVTPEEGVHHDILGGTKGYLTAV